MLVDSLLYGLSQVLAIVDVAIGIALLFSAGIIWLSRWYRRRDVLNWIEEAEPEQ